MTTAPARNRLIAKLHVLKKDQALSDDLYRDKLEAITGHRSAASCTQQQLVTAVEMFSVKQNKNNSYTAKLKALYLATYNLGGLMDGSDAAIDAFVFRQTGKQTIRFLTPPEANSVTEALKAMCARLGFVVPAGDKGGFHARRDLVKAQWARLGVLGAVAMPNIRALENYVSRKYLGHTGNLDHMTSPQLDDCARAFGRQIRRAMAEKGQEAAS